MIKNLFWNSGEGRLRALWRQLLQLVFFYIFSTIGNLLLNLVLAGLLHRRLALNYGASSTYLVGFPSLEIVSALSALLSVWVMARFFNRERFRWFGFQFTKDWWLDCGFGLLLGIFLTTCVFLIELSAGWVTIRGTFFSGAPGLPFGITIVSPFVLFVCAALYEETLYRAYPLRNLAQGFNRRWSIVLLWLLIGLPFGWSHAGNPHAVLSGLMNISLAGLFFGLSYILTGNLGLSIGLHLAWDFCQGCVFGFPVAGVNPSLAASVFTINQSGPTLWTGGAFGPDGGFLVTAAFLFGMLLVLCYVRFRYGKVALYTPLMQYTPENGKRKTTTSSFNLSMGKETSVR